jgi:hypothetical protein
MSNLLNTTPNNTIKDLHIRPPPTLASAHICLDTSSQAKHKLGLPRDRLLHVRCPQLP